MSVELFEGEFVSCQCSLVLKLRYNFSDIYSHSDLSVELWK